MAEPVPTGPVLLGDIRDDSGVWPLWMYNARLQEDVPIESYTPGTWVCNRCYRVAFGPATKCHGQKKPALLRHRADDPGGLCTGATRQNQAAQSSSTGGYEVEVQADGGQCGGEHSRHSSSGANLDLSEVAVEARAVLRGGEPHGAVQMLSLLHPYYDCGVVEGSGAARLQSR